MITVGLFQVLNTFRTSCASGPYMNPSVDLHRVSQLAWSQFIVMLSCLSSDVVFARSATLLLTCCGSAGFFTAQIWKRATAASTEDTRGAFWKPSECELVCHYTNASGRSSELRVKAGGGPWLECFMCVFYGSLSVRQHALAAESRFLKAD